MRGGGHLLLHVERGGRPLELLRRQPAALGQLRRAASLGALAYELGLLPGDFGARAGQSRPRPRDRTLRLAGGLSGTHRHLIELGPQTRGGGAGGLCLRRELAAVERRDRLAGLHLAPLLDPERVQPCLDGRGDDDLVRVHHADQDQVARPGAHERADAQREDEKSGAEDEVSFPLGHGSTRFLGGRAGRRWLPI